MRLRVIVTTLWRVGHVPTVVCVTYLSAWKKLFHNTYTKVLTYKINSFKYVILTTFTYRTLKNTVLNKGKPSIILFIIINLTIN